MSVPRIAAGALLGANLIFNPAAAQDAGDQRPDSLLALEMFAGFIARNGDDSKASPRQSRDAGQKILEQHGQGWVDQLNGAPDQGRRGRCATITHNVEQTVAGKKTVVAIYTVEACALPGSRGRINYRLNSDAGRGKAFCVTRPPEEKVCGPR